MTTRQGDRGTTRLFSGEEVSKASARMEALGDLDELNSALGLARCQAARPGMRESLLFVQKQLFVAAAEAATAQEKAELLTARLGEGDVAEMDRLCAELEAKIEHPHDFIIPGETMAGACLDQARALARRCERRLAALNESRQLENPHLLVWMNRLSDWLWLLARWEEGRSRLQKEKRI
ncbi:MAG: ATP:cob(I)alamin adenosyltransferase [Lentisphaerae bacterium GWF2_57_35]|nr:MAG: ATP:cob(I)alamin adenosyltransferase [Lentisphaerae bacterium GWF2_57_35]